MGQFLRRLAAAGLGLCVAASAQAAGMRIVPLRLDINPKTRLASLELTNISKQDIAVQMDAMAWQQQDGRDAYSETKDLFFAPPIFAIPAGKTKTVRFRLKRGADLNKELSYRVYAQQIAVPPGMGSAVAAMVGGVDVKLRFGIPLFVTAIQPTPPALQAAFARTEAGALALNLSNSGGTHLKIFKAEVLALDGESVLAETGQSNTETNYLLAGNQSLWPLQVPGKPQAAALPPGSYRLRFKTDYYALKRNEAFAADGSLQTTQTLAP